MTAHAKLSPSASSRWLSCTASVEEIAHYPEQTSSEAAEEGTLAHSVVEALLCFADEPPGATEEMRQGAQYMADLVDGLMAQDPEARVFVEQRVSVESILPGCWGTADLIVHLPNRDELHVVDYKFGRIDVSPEHNTQAMIYAVGAVFMLGRLPEKVVITIVQPRSFPPVETWEPTTVDLRQFVKRLKAWTAAPKVYEPSGKNCKYCPAILGCPAVGRLVAGDVASMRLEKALSVVSVIETWAEKVKETALQRLLDGEPLTGWKLVEGRTLRKWVDGVEDGLREAGVPDEIAWQRSVAGIPAVERWAKKNKVSIAHLVEKPKGKPSLAPASDKRPAILPEFTEIS